MSKKKGLEPKLSLTDRLGSGIDKLLSIVAPEVAYRRMAFRQASRIVAGSYRGASTNRLRSDWLPGGGSPDEDLLADLPRLRERSRDLNRNDPHGAGITSTIVSNTVGTGITLQARLDSAVLGLTPEQAEEFQRQCEREWQRWCCMADASERMDFEEIQALVDRQILENGECFFQPVMLDDPNRPYSLALDLIEPDRIETPSMYRSDRSIRSGIHIGDRGQPLAYYVRSSHPGDLTHGERPRSTTYTKVPARNDAGRPNMLHLYEVQRPGQTRGIPYFAPVLTIFKDLGDYMEAELVAARVAACFAIFVKSSNSAQMRSFRANETNGQGQRIENLEPGRIDYLQEGQEIQAFNPNRPSNTFEPFVDRMLRALAGGLNLPYEIVAKDFSKTNYSSARAALLQAYRYFRARQKFLSRRLCQPVYSMVIEEAVLRGYIKLPGFYGRQYEYTRAKWIGQGWQWVDPLKEAMASEHAVKNNISTLADECAAQGKDWEEVVEQRARELKTIKQHEERNGIAMTEESQARQMLENEETDKEEKAKLRNALASKD